MESLSQLIRSSIYPITYVLNFHKKKLLFFVLATLIFCVVFFPFSDLTFYAQNKINEQLKPSGNQIQFSRLGFSLIPFGIKTSDLNLFTPKFSPLTIETALVKPALLSLLKFQPGGTLLLNGLFKGNLEASFSLTGKTEEKQTKFDFHSQTEALSIQELLKFFQIKQDIQGSLKGHLTAKGEESFRTQPSGEFKFNLGNVVLPENIYPEGGLSLPKKVVWKNSNLFGKIEKGRINITNGTLGTKTAPLNGQFKGTVNCTFSKSRGFGANCNKYNFKVELELDREFHQAFQPVLELALQNKAQKTLTSENHTKYLFSASGNFKLPAPPRIEKISQF